MILQGIEYQRPTSLNMRILADHVTYSFLAFMKSIFHFCLGCYCGGYSQNGRSNLSSYLCLSHTICISMKSSPTSIKLIPSYLFQVKCLTYINSVVWLWKNNTVGGFMYQLTNNAKFFWGNINIYLHFMSFLHIDLTQVLKTLLRVREGPTYSM